MSIRSDSKSTVGRLQGTSEIRDILFAQNLRKTKETSGKYGILQ